MVIARKFAYNVIVSSAGKILTTALALVGIGLITRYLGKEGFGNYATAIAYFSLFAAIADLGMYSVATREISRPGANEKEVMGNVFALRIFSSLAVFLTAPLLIFFLPYPQEVKMAILISAAAFVFASSYSVLNGIFQKNLAMDKVAIAEFFGKIVQVGVIFLAVKMQLGFLFVVSSVLFAMIVNFSAVFLWSRKYLKFGFSVNLPYWKKFIKESLPMGVSVIVTFAYFRLDTILLSFLKGGTEVGVYNAAYKVIENLSFFPGMVAGLALPIISRTIFSDRKEFEDTANKVLKFFAILIVPLLIGTLFLADDVISIIVGTGFEESVLVLKILIFALAFIFLGNLTNNIMLAGNLQKSLMLALGFCAVFNISANLIIIPKFSYLGASVISVITEFLVVAITSFIIIKKLSYYPKLENVGKILFSGILMAAFFYFLKGANFFLLALSGTLVYGAAIWITKTISTQEIRSIIKKN
jgi:O-antigen/teichoic acid export membrane protein